MMREMVVMVEIVVEVSSCSMINYKLRYAKRGKNICGTTDICGKKISV